MKVSDLRRKLMAALAAGGMFAPGYLHAANLNTNLVVNGDFETVDVNTLGGNYTSPKILDWTGASAFAYAHLGAGGIGPDYANNAPLVSGGQYYFSADHHADPQNVDITAAGQFYQDIAVNAGATGTQIATGTAGYQISGFFSGYTTQPDKGTIQVDFLNGSGGTLPTF